MNGASRCFLHAFLECEDRGYGLLVSLLPGFSTWSPSKPHRDFCPLSKCPGNTPPCGSHQAPDHLGMNLSLALPAQRQPSSGPRQTWGQWSCLSVLYSPWGDPTGVPRPPSRRAGGTELKLLVRTASQVVALGQGSPLIPDPMLSSPNKTEKGILNTWSHTPRQR